MRDDGWKAETREPVPIVAGLIAHENDGVRVEFGRLFERGAGVFDVAGGVESHGSSVVLAHRTVGVEEHARDFLTGVLHGLHIPRADTFAIVTHASRVVDDDDDSIATYATDHLLDRNGCSHARDPELIAGLE